MNEVDQRFFGGSPGAATPEDIVARMRPYIAEQLVRGVWLQRITRHMLGLFYGLHGGKHWRRVLSEEAVKPGAGLEVLDRALAAVRDHVPPHLRKAA